MILLCMGLNGLNAQCECTDCPINIPNNGTATSELDISGATNNTLGSGGQELCMLCIDLVYDAIQELDMTLVAPSGDEVDLMINTGLAVNDNISFNICFVSCNQSADPDPGFPAVFDTDAGYQPNQAYDGSYYPADGCFEDLTGDVNGTWELVMTDNVTLDNGDLFDWYMVFTDDSGLGCANAGACSNSVSCIANGGELGGSSLIEACEGDAILNLDIPVNYPGGGEPPVPEYEYTYIINNTDIDVIEDITMTTDLTSYQAGNYEICGLSYLADDASSIPAPDGSLSVSDIQDDIDDDLYCADISDNCITIQIDETVDIPDFVGPENVCADELVIYEILNYDPSVNYLISINSGSFAQFIANMGVIEVIWISGPGEICVIAESTCGDETTCLNITVGDTQADYTIDGELDPCPGSTEIYTIDPEAPAGANYIYTAIGGTIINSDASSFEVEWQGFEGPGEICVELVGTACPVDIICEQVDIELDYELPGGFDNPEEICLNQEGTASTTDDIDIIEFFWTVSGEISIIEGQGTDEIDFEGTAAGLGSICLEILTACGMQGPVCETIEILAVPEPEILEPTLSCGNELTLEAITDPDNELEWNQLSGPGDVDFNPVDENITTAEFSNPGTYQIELIEENDACLASDIIEITISDELQVSEENYDCDLDNNYTVSFEILSGSAPYQVNGNVLAGNSFSSDLFNSGEDYSFELIDDLGCSVVIEGDYECPCVSDAGSMSDDLLLACVDLNDIIEAEWEEDGILDNNDIGLFYLHDGDSEELGFIFDINDTGEFEFTDEMVLGQTYYISYVVANNNNGETDFDDPCLSVALGQPVLFLGIPEINPLVQKEACSNRYFFDIEEEGLELLNIVQLSGPSQSQLDFSNDLPAVITFNETGEYLFEYEITNGACTVFGEFLISYEGNPNIISLVETCTGTADSYIINLIVSGGIPPYSSSIAGSFSDSLFISDPIPTGQSYSIVITDASGCSSIALEGQKLCDCISNADLLDQNLISACGENDTIFIAEPENFSLDSNDLSLYFLHRSPVFNYDERIDSSFSGSFSFNADSLFLDTIYYVSFLVGNALTNTVDINDPCVDISNSQPIVWYSLEEANAGPDTITCEEKLSMSASPLSGSWRILEEVSPGSLVISSLGNAQAEITLNEIGVYRLIWESTQNNCMVSDTVRLERAALPVIEGYSTECKDDLSTYSVQVQFPPGESYIIKGDEYTGFYFEDNIIASDSFELIIENSFGCTEVFTLAPIDCSCSSSIDSDILALQELCMGELLDAAQFFSNYTLGDQDSLVYILHDGTESSIGSILLDSVSEFAFDNSLETDKVYYVNLVISPFNGTSLDFNDPCTLVSNALPVIWYDENEVTISGDLSACEGDSINLRFDVSRYVPIDIRLLSNTGLDKNETLFNPDTSISIMAVPGMEFIDVEIMSGLCTELQQIRLEVEVQEELDIDFVQDPRICNNSLFGSILFLDSLLLTENVQGDWFAPDLPLLNNRIDLDGIMSASYQLIFSTEGYEELCPGNTFMLELFVEDCICPELSFSDLELCSATESISLDEFDTQGFDGLWNIQAAGNQQILPEVLANELTGLSSADPGLYNLIFSISDPGFPSVCNSDFDFEINLYQAPNAGNQLEFPVLCMSDTEEIFLADLLQDEDENGQWIYQGQEIGPVLNSELLSQGLNEIIYFMEENGPCAETETTLIIELYPEPELIALAEDVLCFGDENGTISITVIDNTGDSVDCYINELLQANEKIIEDLAPGAYEVYVENDYCRSETVLLEIEEPEAVTVSLGDDRQVNIEESILITAITNILESDIGEISWSDLSGIIGVDVLELRESFSSDNTILVEITDESGCVGFDELKINVILPDIYIPNVFNPTSLDNSEFGIQNPEALERVESFRIYDRWGNLILNEVNLEPFSESARWDGYYDGSKAQTGVYVYLYELTLKTGERLILSGDITLLW